MVGVLFNGKFSSTGPRGKIRRTGADCARRRVRGDSDSGPTGLRGGASPGQVKAVTVRNSPLAVRSFYSRRLACFGGGLFFRCFGIWSSLLQPPPSLSPVLLVQP